MRLCKQPPRDSFPDRFRPRATSGSASWAEVATEQLLGKTYCFRLDKDLSIAFTLLEDCYIEKKYYKFKYNSEIVSILIDDILYLETSDHLTTIYTNLNQYHIYKSLKDIQEEIHSQNLIQINRKTIINILHISFDKKNTVTLDNKKTFKIGRTFKKNFNDAFSTFIFKGE